MRAGWAEGPQAEPNEGRRDWIAAAHDFAAAGLVLSGTHNTNDAAAAADDCSIVQVIRLTASG